MKSFKFISVFVIVVLFLLTALGWTTRRDINLGAFLKELTVINVKGNQTQFAIWLPFEFNVNAIGAGAKTPMDSSLKPYLIFMVQCSVDSDGRQTYASWSQIQNRAFLKGSSPARLEPLTLVPAELVPKLEAVKTAIINNGGSVANSHILIFDVNDPNGKALVDTTKRDKLTLILDASGPFSSTEFTWHTPFNAVIDAGNCSKCGEKVRAQWYYCPCCGNKL